MLQSQVDMEDLFKLLETQSTLPDGTKELPSPAAEAIPAAEGSSSGSSSDADENEAGQPQASASSRANGATSNGSNGAGARQSQQQRGSGKGANARGLRVELRGVRFGYGGGRQVRPLLPALPACLRAPSCSRWTPVKGTHANIVQLHFTMGGKHDANLSACLLTGAARRGHHSGAGREHRCCR